jgi:hypothetical protein
MYFNCIWKQECSHVRVRRHTTLAICSVCDAYTSDMCKYNSYTDRHRLTLGYQKHRAHQRGERYVYQGKREEARRNPKDVLSLIIDGANQELYAIPSTRTNVRNDASFYPDNNLSFLFSFPI